MLVLCRSLGGNLKAQAMNGCTPFYINMKLKLLLFMLLCVFTTSVAQHKINKGWSFYQEDGKWGVLYKGEPCLLPRFDGVSGTIENGKFVYKENNKYGISTVWKK